MIQWRQYLIRKFRFLQGIGGLVVLTLVLLTLSSGDDPTGGQVASAIESSTVMQVQHPSSLQQRPAIDLALPQVTEKALFALG